MPNIFERAKGAFFSLINARLIKDVTMANNILYLELVRRTSSGKYPEKITEAIKTSSAQYENGKIVAKIDIDLNIAPMALAFEYGSGIWSEEGPQEKYLIEPTEASMLAFDWPNAASIAQREGVNAVNFGPDGHVVLPRVMHPGIQARPYIRPAIAEKSDEIAELLGNGFIEVLSESLGPDVIVIK